MQHAVQATCHSGGVCKAGLLLLWGNPSSVFTGCCGSAHLAPRVWLVCSGVVHVRQVCKLDLTTGNGGPHITHVWIVDILPPPLPGQIPWHNLCAECMDRWHWQAAMMQQL